MPFLAHEMRWRCYDPVVATLCYLSPGVPGPAGPGEDSAFVVREKLQTGLCYRVLEPASKARRVDGELMAVERDPSCIDAP